MIARPRLHSVLIFACLSFLFANCTDDTPTTPTPTPCAYSFVPANATVDSAGGDRTVQVVTSDSCEWTVSSTVPWITLPSGNAGRGPATVPYRVAANPDEAGRAGTLRVETYTFPVTQAGRQPCSYDVAPLDRGFDGNGGAGTITVTTQAECPWTAVSDAAWVTIAEGAQGLGPGDVKYSVGRHDGQQRRSATIVVAGQAASIVQEPLPGPVLPCEYTVTPTDIGLHWHQTGAHIALSTAPHCQWTAAAGAAWLSLLSSGEGTGPAQVSFANSVYTGLLPRRAPIEIRWPTETAGQNVWVTQEGCGYALAPATVDIGVNGGNAQIIVLASPMSVDCNVGCPWNAESLAPWIQVLSSMPRAGDDGLFFRVDANATGPPRTGRIRVEHLFLTIKQAGR